MCSGTKKFRMQGTTYVVLYCESPHNYYPQCTFLAAKYPRLVPFLILEIYIPQLVKRC